MQSNNCSHLSSYLASRALLCNINKPPSKTGSCFSVNLLDCSCVRECAERWLAVWQRKRMTERERKNADQPLSTQLLVLCYQCSSLGRRVCLCMCVCVVWILCQVYCVVSRVFCEIEFRPSDLFWSLAKVMICPEISFSALKIKQCAVGNLCLFQWIKNFHLLRLLTDNLRCLKPKRQT